MIKLLFVFSLAVFAAAGLLFLLFVDAGVEPGPSGEIPEVFADYDSAVSKDDLTLRSLLLRSSEECENYACMTLKAYEYVKNDIEIADNITDSDLNPFDTLRRKRGSPESAAVLLASFLENAGVRSFVRKTGGSVYAYACGIRPAEIYSAAVDELHKTPLASRKTVLNKSKVWAARMERNSGVPLPVDIEAEGSKPFDVLLFPDGSEMDAYLRYMDGRFLRECSRFDVMTAEFSCVLPPDGAVVFISREDGNVFSGEVLKGGLLLSDVETAIIEGETCIPMKTGPGGFYAYPGIKNGSM